MKKLFVLLSVFMCGCSNMTTSVYEPDFDSKCRFGTVTHIDDNTISIHFSTPFPMNQSFTISSDTPILKDDLTISYTEIKEDDCVLCTFTNGVLTVVEVCEADTKQG